MDLRLSLSPSGPPQKCRAQPAPHPESGTRMGHRGQRAPSRCITQHEAPRARTRGWAQPTPYAPLLVSSVPVCSQRPKHLAEEETVEWQGLPPAWGSLDPGV